MSIGLAAVPVTGASPALAGSPALVAVPIAVLGGQGEPGGASPTVQITVGGWGPLPRRPRYRVLGPPRLRRRGECRIGGGRDQPSVQYHLLGGLPFQRGGRVRRGATRNSEDDRTRPICARTKCLVHRHEARLPSRQRDRGIRVGPGCRRHPRHRNAEQCGRGDESTPRHGWAAGQEVECAYSTAARDSSSWVLE